MTTVVQNIENTTVVVGGIMGPPGASGLITASADVDVTNLQDGSVLVYNTEAAKWQAAQILEKQIINAGFF